MTNGHTAGHERAGAKGRWAAAMEGAAVKLRRIAGRVGLVISVAALVVMPLAAPAQAGAIECTAVLLGGDPVRDGGHYVNCNLDSAGTCTVLYDPLIDGNNPVIETIEYADCLA